MNEVCESIRRVLNGVAGLLDVLARAFDGVARGERGQAKQKESREYREQ